MQEGDAIRSIYMWVRIRKVEDTRWRVSQLRCFRRHVCCLLVNGICEWTGLVAGPLTESGVCF
jgi:hypothetical protein